MRESILQQWLTALLSLSSATWSWEKRNTALLFEPFWHLRAYPSLWHTSGLSHTHTNTHWKLDLWFISSSVLIGLWLQPAIWLRWPVCAFVCVCAYKEYCVCQFFIVMTNQWSSHASWFFQVYAWVQVDLLNEYSSNCLLCLKMLNLHWYKSSKTYIQAGESREYDTFPAE